MFFPIFQPVKHNWREFITDELEQELKKQVADANHAWLSGRISDLMSALNLMSQQISGTLVHEIYTQLIRLFFEAVSVYGEENFGNYSEEQLIAQGKIFL